jgi:hypothetical protein
LAGWFARQGGSGVGPGVWRRAFWRESRGRDGGRSGCDVRMWGRMVGGLVGIRGHVRLAAAAEGQFCPSGEKLAMDDSVSLEFG